MDIPAMPGSSQPLSVSLVGTWELLSRVDHTSSGERRIDPGLGDNPIALLMYDDCGHFAAQFMKRDRTLQPETPVAPATENNSGAQHGYDAYFGTYTTDDVHDTVTQTLTGALSPENVGQVLTRAMTVANDELTIQVLTAAPSGEPLTRILRWKRVG